MKTILKFSHREYRSFIGNSPGIHSVLPVIVTDDGVLEQFARYMYLNRSKSRSWQDSCTFAIQLLLEYLEVNHDSCATARGLFTTFAEALHTGTIEDYRDPSYLWWVPRRPEDANKIINHVTSFSDWLSVINEEINLQLNPWKQATRHEQRLNWAAYVHKRDNAFLSHLWRENETAKLSRSVRSKTLTVERTTRPKTFPDENFNSLLEVGFNRRARDQRGTKDLRNILISYLMHYGGLRLSEALSLWSGDVSVERGEVIVRVYHPEYGQAPDNSTRTIYLAQKFGLKPRKKLVKATDPLFLGWKDGLITDPQRRCFEVFFYPESTGNEFAMLWRDYHMTQRVSPNPGENHPYAFTNKSGRAYSHRMFRKAHKLAIQRINLEYGKLQGTTPHGHRHAYGQRLAANGANPLLIKSAMHHASIESSQVYTQPTASEVRARLNELESRMLILHGENLRVDTRMSDPL